MMIFDKFKCFYKLQAMLLVVVCCVAKVNAQVIDDKVEIDGIVYMTSYYQYNYVEPGYYGDPDWREYYLLENEVKRMRDFTRKLCKANETDGVHFYDGSRIAMFDYPAIVFKRTSTKKILQNDENAVSESEPTSTYAGDVWIQDSVKMRDLPNLRKTKFHYVCDILATFDKNLKSIRTPRYVVVRKGMFKDFPALHTARIGAAQLVETGAFENCSALGTVFFETAPYVRDEAFKNCPNIRYVVMDGKLPKPCDEYQYGYDEEDRSPFDEVVYEQAILYVHEDQMEGFRQDKTWGKFKNIRDIEEYMAGVESVEPDTAVVYDVYDLSGTQVRSVRSGENWREGLPAGLYIVKSSRGTVRKEIIR